MKKLKDGQIYILFEDYHNDGMDKVVIASKKEWKSLIKPAVDNDYPIDGATVDHDIFDILYDRPSIDLKMSEVDKIQYVIPLV